MKIPFNFIAFRYKDGILRQRLLGFHGRLHHIVYVEAIKKVHRKYDERAGKWEKQGKEELSKNFH